MTKRQSDYHIELFISTQESKRNLPSELDSKDELAELDPVQVIVSEKGIRVKCMKSIKSISYIVMNNIFHFISANDHSSSGLG